MPSRSSATALPPELRSDPSRATRLRRRLVDWYLRAARDLPWRRTSDPYAIWLSEVMLQQTRVEAVVGYWQRFLDALPTVGDLAAADEDRVLGLWSGLGYYRRARSLHAAAKLVVERHGGELPDDPALLADLPGFGPYTVGAVAPIAFGRRVGLVDGNVARVFARLFELELEPNGGPWRRTNQALAEELLPGPRARPERGPGTWNQALMELGATVCTPRAPRCGSCPVAGDCRALAAGRVEELPLPPKRRAAVDLHVQALWVEAAAGVLLRRRPKQGRNPGLFDPPARELAAEPTRPAGLWPADFAGAELDALWDRAEPRADRRHAITHHRIRVEVRVLALESPAIERLAAATAYDLVPRAELDRLPLSGLAKKLRAAP